MRTTLNLDDAVVQLLRNYASERSIPLGTAASELVRRGLETPVQLRMVNGFYAVDLPADGKQVSSARVKELLAEEI
jgi:hypothetical protein